MDDHEVIPIVEPAPEIIITSIDGLDVHTEAVTNNDDRVSTAREESNHAPDPSIDSLYGLPNGHGPSDLDLHVVDQGIPQAQFVSPIYLEKTPSHRYESPKSELWNKETPDQTRIITLEADIERMMDRFDELKQQCQLYAEQRDEAQSQAASLQKRFERVLEECRQAKAEKNDIKSELDKMKMPSLPGEDHDEYTKIENIRLKTELEKAKKSMESRMQDFEFVRQQYQQSSTAAADLANDNAILKEEIDRMKNQMEGGMGYKLAVAQCNGNLQAISEQLESTECRNLVLIEQVRRMKDDKLVARGRENRRDLTAHERERKRAISASDVGHRKKIEKLGVSRLSVAALITPSSEASGPGPEGQQPQQMLRGHSHDSGTQPRDRERFSTATKFNIS